jgi:hypothetical protein
LLSAKGSRKRLLLLLLLLCIKTKRWRLLHCSKWWGCSAEGRCLLLLLVEAKGRWGLLLLLLRLSAKAHKTREAARAMQ